MKPANVERMDVIFAGTGSAFTLENWQSNMVIEIALVPDATGDGSGPDSGLDSANPSPARRVHRLLLDCGSDARHSLRELGLGAADLDAIYISHAHGDHIGGLEWAALSTYFNPTLPRPKLFINRQLSKLVWQSLKGGLDTIQGERVKLDTFFEVERLPDNGKFAFAGIEFQTIQSIHFMAGFQLSPSFGLIVNAPDGREIFFTTDTQFAPNQLRDFYQRADVIFQDCETAPFKSGVHAHYEELKSLPAALKAKMWLYHYQDGKRPNAVADGFAGFIEKGQRFSFAAHSAHRARA